MKDVLSMWRRCRSPRALDFLLTERGPMSWKDPGHCGCGPPAPLQGPPLSTWKRRLRRGVTVRLPAAPVLTPGSTKTPMLFADPTSGQTSASRRLAKRTTVPGGRRRARTRRSVGAGSKLQWCAGLLQT